MVSINVGKINASKKIVLEIKNNFVDNDLKLDVAFEYIDTEDKKHSIEETKELEVFKSISELEKAKENKEVVEYVLELINRNNLLKVAESYELNDSAGVLRAFNLTSNSLSNLSKIVKLADFVDLS